MGIGATVGCKAEGAWSLPDDAALDQIAAALGLFITDPDNNPVATLLYDVTSLVRQTGRAVNTPEGA